MIPKGRRLFLYLSVTDPAELGRVGQQGEHADRPDAADRADDRGPSRQLWLGVNGRQDHALDMPDAVVDQRQAPACPNAQS